MEKEREKSVNVSNDEKEEEKKEGVLILVYIKNNKFNIKFNKSF